MEKKKFLKLVDTPIGIGISVYFVSISGWYRYIWLYLYLLTIVYGRYTYSNLMAGRPIIGIGIYRITYKWPI